jgi:hypothetical protein
LKRNQFGAALGGPIRKDRTFFFLNYEGVRQAAGTSFLGTVLTPETRQGKITGCPAGRSGCTREEAIVTRTLPVNPDMAPVMNLLPLPNGPYRRNGVADYTAVPRWQADENYMAACQKGFRVRFTTAASLAHELIEAKDERRLMRFQKMLSSFELLIIDELGFVPLSKTGAELLFEVFSRRYERSSTLVTSNLPFNEWTEAFGSERLTGALLDRLTRHVHILEMNGESYRLKDSKRQRPGKPRS